MLNNNKVIENIQLLLDIFEESQWNHDVNFEYASKFSVMTRSDLQTLKMKRYLCSTRTSGSTGEPITIEKTILDHIWYVATNIREIRWRKWDATKNIAIIKDLDTCNVFLAIDIL